MTGCPNGCARPYNSDIGLVGKTKDKYTIFLGGRVLGDRLNFIYKDLVPTDEVVPTLVPVLRYFKDARQNGESFGDFCHRVGMEDLKAKCEGSFVVCSLRYWQWSIERPTITASHSRKSDWQSSAGGTGFAASHCSVQFCATTSGQIATLMSWWNLNLACGLASSFLRFRMNFPKSLADASTSTRRSASASIFGIKCWRRRRCNMPRHEDAVRLRNMLDYTCEAVGPAWGG